MRATDMAGMLRPGRRIRGVSAVLLPYDAVGAVDEQAWTVHLRRTHEAGLVCAINMDTGYGPQLSPGDRQHLLRIAREALGAEVPLVAGAMPFGHDADPLTAYRTEVDGIAEQGATPILFPSPLLAAVEGEDLAKLVVEIVGDCPEALGFELGTMFAPFGRIWDLDTFRRLLDIEPLVGLKHSSLSRIAELERLRIRDEVRPEFRVYTGNDLAIDLVAYGSDYLLGLSTFDPAAFALRDRLWADDDARFWELNDALQTVGAVAFRPPVPAYKASAAVYLRLTGQMDDPQPHPACPARPGWEEEILRPLAAVVAGSSNIDDGRE